ncbi:hypothetical protein [Levilactobacillus brevis]|uniref:hypothetical protein n=1 Tax=Levilactobacillus brevis TaxID=1580 RepID=UPI0008482BEB|nr:hypothetical protein [Levilactobacillus brevis]ODP92844.1 hypothetical protein BGC39_01205 [Levilactobacillus brevis]ODP92885.1 hypothetical protein BGC39_01430 [Levilactobacillus brevis]
MILKKLTAQDANTIAEQFLKNKYHDRGMLKWQGFFLSDHTSAIKKEVNSPIVDCKINPNAVWTKKISFL